MFFHAQGVQYLGYTVYEDGFKPDPTNLQTAETYLAPTDLKQLCHFLGVSDYYQCYIQDYLKIPGPLHRPTGKASNGLNWSSECQEALNSSMPTFESIQLV